ncbi:jg9436 [Pararge aegeria aegeria]|uniref:Jg9436 protein n=1 Tax=Pararge aegeria aegeria TaxID=348720 RepID=A0A8S4SL17_9NEOP|nr:jg9436 [Pararge aegeria aegeria]
MLAQTLLLPIIDYADASFVDLTEDQLNKLERLQNTSIRFIFGLRKYDHISQFRSRLKWLPIRLRRNLHILSILYCILFHPSTPVYLKEKFVFTGPPEDARSTRRFILKVPGHKSSFFHKSFTVPAVTLWNALPLEIREAQTIGIFKKQVKDHYLSVSAGH